MRIARLLALVVGGLSLVALPRTAAAQKQCTKGKPCGNTCIAADKVCRQGTPSVEATPSLRFLPGSKLFNPDYPWAASPRGRTYYANLGSCPGIRKLKGLVFYRTEYQALKAGLRRSRQAGC